MTITKRAIGTIKVKRTVYCTICGCSHNRVVNVKIYSKAIEEIEAAKLKATLNINKSYTCRVCKSIEKEAEEMKIETKEVTPVIEEQKENEVTNKEYHTNGELSYIETIRTITKVEAKNYNSCNIRTNENGVITVRVGLCAKYHNNGQLAWMIEYDNKGKKVESDSTKYHKDGSIIEY